MSNAEIRTDRSLSEFYFPWGDETFRIGDRVEVSAEGTTLRGRISGIIQPSGTGLYGSEDGRGVGFTLKQHYIHPEEGRTVIRRVD